MKQVYSTCGLNGESAENRAAVDDVPAGYWERLAEAFKRLKPLPELPPHDEPGPFV